MEDDSEQLAPEPLTEREMEILRHIAEGLSDREIAQELFLSLNTVKWYNREIYSKLAVGNRRQAARRARTLGLIEGAGEQATTTVIPPPTKHNLPAQVTSFIGREREAAKIKALLDITRLLTLTGPGGTGKTRLALQVAAQAVDVFADGVYFVGLASLSDPGLVANAIAGVLGVAESASEPLPDSLARALSHRQTLLVLDNFEHLLRAAPLVSDLLSAAPNLKVLATSREVLRLYGEREYVVLPLALPDLERQGPLEELALSEAVTLFVERTQAAQHDFELTEANASAVARLCVHLDGLPLAIELAAARAKLLPPEALLERLADRLGELTGGSRDLPARQRTLRATLDWSYDLLNSSEKALFSRLALFSGGCTLDAVETVCSEGLPGDMFDTLASLVDKSLVLQGEGKDGDLRFRMLETVREYAWQRLEASGEVNALRGQHTTYHLALAEAAELGLRGPDQRLWLNRLKADEDNLRAALEWSGSEQGSPEMGLRLAGALWLFWDMRGNLREGRRWLEALLSLTPEAAPATRAKALYGAGVLAYRQGDYKKVAVLSDDALTLCQQTGDKWGSALALHYLAHVAQHQGDHTRATELMEESVGLYRELADKWGLALSLNCLGDLHRGQGIYDRAAELLEQALGLARERNNTGIIAFAVLNLGHVLLRQGHLEQAANYYEEGLAIAREVGNQAEIGLSFTGLAGVAAATGQAERAARLFGAAEALFSDSGYELEPADRPDYEHNVRVARSHMDETSFKTAWAEGRTLTLEQAIAYALGEDA